MACKQQKARIYAYATFDAAALLSIARSIRKKSYLCDESQRPKSGSLNWIIFFTFEDGVEWVFRSPRKAFGLQKNMASQVLASEVATLNYLQRAGSIPVPQVFSYCATDENPTGIPYILMSKAPGVPLGTYSRSDHRIPSSHVCGDSERTLTSFQKRKVMEQLGGMQASMSNLQFDHVGSLFAENEGYTIGKCLLPCLILQGRDEFNEDEIPRGPFRTSAEFYAALIHAFFAHVKELPMEHHLLHGPVPIPQEYNNYEDYRAATDRWNDYVAVGSKTESMKNRLDYALVGVSLTDWVPSLAENDNQFKCTGFPLYHPDLSTQNIFVDDDFNITCIIDWAFASCVPPSMLLISPGLPHPRDSIQPSLRESFAKGFVAGHGFDGQNDLDFSRSGIYWAFLRLVNLDSLQDYVHFSKLVRSFGDQEVFSHIYQLKTREEFKKISSFLGEDEAVPGESTKDESQYFSCVGPERLALFRHLTMIPEMNPTFVADKRLWKCIMAYMKGRESIMFVRDQEQTPGRKRKLDRLA